MNNYAYAERTGKEYSIFLFNDDQQIDSSNNFQALMMSRLDFDVKILELPSIPVKEIEGFLTYKISSLYPGQPEETVFDYLKLNKNKKKYAVIFISQKSTLNEYQKIAGGRPLFLPFTLIHSLVNKYAGQGIIFLFWHRLWIEALVFPENEAPTSFVLKRRKNITLDFNRVNKVLPEDIDGFRAVIFCSDQEKELLAEGINRLAVNDEAFEIHSITETLNKITRKTEFLFAKKKRKGLVQRKVRLQILIAVMLFLGVFLFKRNVDQKEVYFQDLKNYLGLLQKQTLKVISIQGEIDDLQEKLDIIKGKKPIEPYLILSELASILKPGTKIQSFILEKNYFQLEAVGPNPLDLMEIFKVKALFGNVKLVQIVPIKDSDKELFKITGKINVD